MPVAWRKMMTLVNVAYNLLPAPSSQAGGSVWRLQKKTNQSSQSHDVTASHRASYNSVVDHKQKK